MTRPIVTVVYAEVTAPVVAAQTPPLLRAWRDAGRAVDAAVLTSPRAVFLPGARRAHRAALLRIQQATGRAPWTRTHLPRDIGLARDGAAMARALRARGVADPILFCRQPRAALVGIAARERLAAAGAPSKVVLDLRGLRDVEYLLSLGREEAALEPTERDRLETYRRQERDACRGADLVLCVSQPMVRAVRERHGVEEKRLGRAPNHAGEVRHAEELRVAARAEIGVAADALLVIYSGTMAAWQKPAESAMLVRALRAQRPDVRLLFLTPELDAARAAVASLGPDGAEGVLFRSARPGEVERYLCAADYGLLLRDDVLVNRAACPVKFGEYLACGVRPLLTPAIGDQSDLCMQSDLGVVVGLGDPAAAAKRVALDLSRPGTIDADGRARRRAWAAAHISPAAVAARIAAFVDGT